MWLRQPQFQGPMLRFALQTLMLLSLFGEWIVYIVCACAPPIQGHASSYRIVPSVPATVGGRHGSERSDARHHQTRRLDETKKGSGHRRSTPDKTDDETHETSCSSNTQQAGPLAGPSRK